MRSIPLDDESSTPDDAPQRKGLVLALLIASTLAAIVWELYNVGTTRRGFALDSRAGAALARRWGPFLLAALLCAIPWVRNTLSSFLDRLRNPTPRARRVTTLGIALAASLYLFVTASLQHRDLTAKQQDESMYLVQTQMLARGRLWMPQHEHPDFFESFHVLVRPKYAGMYFPGTALAYAPSIWLGLPPWAWSILIAGAAVGMTYRVLTELVDGVAGWLAVLLLIASSIFRFLSVMVMSHTLMLLLALLMTWAFLCWRREHRLRFAALCGLFAGWAAITRPLDALCYAVPLMFAVAWELRRAPWRQWLGFAAVAFLAAAPLLALQLILDYGVTGRLLLTPVTLYHQHYWPQAMIGFSGNLEGYQPPTDRIQFHQYYDHYITPSFNQFRDHSALKLLTTVRLPMYMNAALPCLLLAAFIPLSLFRMRRPGRSAFFLALPLFFGGYATFMFFRKHYGAVFFPPLFLSILLGARAVEQTWPQWRNGWNSFIALAILGLTLASLPEIIPGVRDQMSPTPILHEFNRAVRKLEHKPALVFVHQDGGNDDWSQEPVYNTDVAWPDDAAVVRAHDLGPRNIELIRYYAQRQPARAVYLFDKPTLKMIYLGMATELAKKSP